jgi:hypothetical protein
MHGRHFFIALLLSFFTPTIAQASGRCISHEDLQIMAGTFSQLQRFVGNQTEYCPGDFNADWFKVAQSLDILLNIQPDEPDVSQDDGLTYKAISEKDWWAYFTQRADTFSIERNCPQNVVAFVRPGWGNGRIHLCRPFFEQTPSDQASTMMHEVRHFDGHGHVTCTQGNEQGVRGACDNRINQRGSYAISVQTLVGMARAPSTPVTERPLLEAQAVYMAFNKFNQVPKVRLNNSILLSNEQAEIYSWTLDGDIEKVGDLAKPAIVYNSANNLTIYPESVDSEAYRKDNKLLAVLDNPGLYAKHYNSETPEERAQYQAISYFATGGLLKNNTLLTLCDRQNLKLAPENLDHLGHFVTIISMSLDDADQQRESLLLADNGDLYRYECRSQNSSAVRIEKLAETLKVPGGQRVLDSFGFAGKQYALLDDGALALVEIRGSQLLANALSFPSLNQNWISATPMSTPEVF